MTYDAKEKSAFGGAPVELYKFTVGGTSYHYTSADGEQTYLGDIYATEAISRGEIDQSGEGEQGAVTVTVPRSNPVALFFVPFIPEPPMALTIFRFHRGDPEVVAAWTGGVASAAFTESSVTLTCLPIFEILRRKIPANTYQTQCNWALYSAECGVSQAAFRLTGSITVISGDTIQASEFSTKADGWFNNGWVELMTGEKRWIVDHVGATITLMNPFLSDQLSVTDDVYAFAGCDRTESVCKTKFSNIENHLGFARVPKRNPFELGVG